MRVLLLRVMMMTMMTCLPHWSHPDLARQPRIGSSLSAGMLEVPTLAQVCLAASH